MQLVPQHWTRPCAEMYAQLHVCMRVHYTLQYAYISASIRVRTRTCMLVHVRDSMLFPGIQPDNVRSIPVRTHTCKRTYTQPPTLAHAHTYTYDAYCVRQSAAQLGKIRLASSLLE